MIVWIASYPRSGNNLFLTTLRAVYGVTPGSVYTDTSDAPFVKTHNLAERCNERPAVYIVRDGRDSLVSYAHFTRMQGDKPFVDKSYEETLGTLIRRRGGRMGNWSENVHSWRVREAPTALVCYEDLIEDPPTVVRRAVESLGRELPEPDGRMPTFEEMHRTHPHLIRRGEVGSWRDEMPPELHDLFWELHGEEMRALGYPRAG